MQRSTSRNVLLGALVIAAITCSDSPAAPGPNLAPTSLVASHDSLVLAVYDSAVTWVEARNSASALVIAPSVTWTSIDPAIATVVFGKIRALSPGSTRITISSAALADTIPVRVLPLITATTLSRLGDTLRSLGDRAELLAKSVAGTDPREGRYTFVSRNPEVVVVEDAEPWGSARGRAVTPGSTWVVVTEQGGTKDSARVTVSPSLATVVFGADIFPYLGRTAYPNVHGTDANGNVVPSARISFRVLDETIAHVIPGGGIAFDKVGATRLEAISDLGAHSYYELVVKPPPVFELSLSGGVPDTLFVGTGQSVSVTAYTSGPYAQPILNATAIGPALTAQVPDGAFEVVMTGLQPGDAKVILSSPHIIPDTLNVRVNTSRIHIENFGVPSMVVGQSRTASVYAADSIGIWRDFLADVPIAITSSAPSIVRVEQGSQSILQDRFARAPRSIQLTAVASGTAHITASAPGLVSYEQDIHVTSQPSLHFLLTGDTVLGASQVPAAHPSDLTRGWRVGASNGAAAVVTFTHTNPAVASTVAQLALPVGHQWVDVNVNALTPGLDSIIVSAPGFIPDTAALRVSTPRFMHTPAMTTWIGAPKVSLGVTDSLDIRHGALTDVSIIPSSSDSSILIPQAATLPEGSRSGHFMAWTILDTGQVNVTLTDQAGVIPPMIIPVHVVASPVLGIGVGNDFGQDIRWIGVRQRFDVLNFVFAHFSGAIPPGPVQATYSSTDMAVFPASGTLNMVPVPGGGITGTAIPMPAPIATGTVRLVISAPGYVPDTTDVIEVGVPRLRLDQYPARIDSGAAGNVRVRLSDQRNRTRVTDVPVTFKLSVPGGGLAETQVTIAAGGSESALIPVTFTRSGSLQLIASDVGGGLASYEPDTALVLVRNDGERLTVVPDVVTIGVGQRAEMAVERTGFPAGDVATATLASLLGRASVPATISYNGTQGIEPLTLVGVKVGVDTVAITSPGHKGDSVRVMVTEGRVRVPGLPPAPQLGSEYTLTVATTDADGVDRRVNAATTFWIAGSAGLSITDAKGAPLTSVTIAAGELASTPFVLKFTAVGLHSLLVSRLDYVPLSTTITVPVIP